MSKYTTQVRFICESNSGLDESVGFDKIDEVISKSWDKIFTSKVKFFDEGYRSVLCQKILKHYYLREIGSETVGIWKLWMNTKLEEIMPYYNKLYESELIKFNPMHNVDIETTHNRTVDGKTEDNGTSTETSSHNRELNGNKNENYTSDVSGKVDGNTTTDNVKKDLYSDTPQGALTGIESETYLTNARKITDDGSGTSSETSSGNTKDNTTTKYDETEKRSGDINGTTTNTGVSNTVEDYIESIVGKNSSESFSSMLIKFRETFLNIDLQVIGEFEEMFFGLW